MPGQGMPMMGATFGPPPGTDPLWGYFTAIAGQDGEIDAEELQRCLTQSGFSGSYAQLKGHVVAMSQPLWRLLFVDKQEIKGEVVKVGEKAFVRDMTGKMGFNEFKELFAALNGWKQHFMMFDQDRSGTMEPHELAQAFNSMVKRYSKNGRIFFDDYVACCVKLRALTENFKRRDHMRQGIVNFHYDDFILCTMPI
ncbi:hypothetical protein JZ751_027662 [Albula glossodonta]|uniref:EF-hand domain-containing protein n=1 Tax=Albula glossodonta TaxID=121402 RepID=A0A8T2PAG2_9TELE|nr:hypothetical protein JZ751_027662 [Albula glossodonta]